MRLFAESSDKKGHDDADAQRDDHAEDGRYSDCLDTIFFLDTSLKADRVGTVCQCVADGLAEVVGKEDPDDLADITETRDAEAEDNGQPERNIYQVERSCLSPAGIRVIDNVAADEIG